MRRARSWILLVAAASASLSCNQIFGLSAAQLGNDGSSGSDGGNGSNHDAAIDGPNGSGVDAGCPSGCTGNLVCGDGTCVQCTPTSDTCSNLVCGSHNTCQQCTEHTQCASAVCLASGECAAEHDIAYVAGSGSDPVGSGSAADCTRLAPCLTLTAALGALDGRFTVKVLSTITSHTLITAGSGSAITIIGDRGVGLRGDTSDPTIEIDGPANIVLQDLDITNGAPGVLLASGSGLGTLKIVHSSIHNNPGFGLLANPSNAATMTLEVARSFITGNGSGGAAITQGTIFRVVGNLIANNGGGSSPTFGGLLLSANAGSSDTAEFNTIVGNSSSGSAAGITCSAAMQVDSNIVANNVALDQISASGGCTISSTLVSSGVLAGSGNKSGDPNFVGSADFHLKSPSLAIGTASSTSDRSGDGSSDLDGVLRPQSGPTDMGAFVFVGSAGSGQ
jgi:hypothetical protein